MNTLRTDEGLVRGLYAHGERVRQSPTTNYTREELLWAAGLFVGEGTAYNLKQKPGRAGNLRLYPTLGLKMLDGRAVEQFSSTFGLRFRIRPYKTDGAIFEARLTGAGAEVVARALYPEIAGTTKGDQVARVFREAGRNVLPAVAPANQSIRDRGRPLVVPTGKRRLRSWLLDTSKFDRKETVWASGLFAGEGYSGIQNKKKGTRTFRYPMLSLSMLDRHAVSRFGVTFYERAYELPDYGACSGPCYRVHVNGSAAEAALRAMYPHLRDTDKGDQIRAVFQELQLELCEDGSGKTWERSNGWEGRKLSPSHKAALAAGRDRYWKAWHRAK